MKLHKESHLDHGLTARQLAHVLLAFEGRDAFFKLTMQLPDDLGTVPCNLYGPIMGDEQVPSSAVEMVSRGGGRSYPSRRLLDEHVPSRSRTTNTVSVIAGPHEEQCAKCGGRGYFTNPFAWYSYGDPNEQHKCEKCTDGKVKHPCILYTVFGGPIAPKEPDDPTLTDEQRPESIAFWAEHALAF